MLKPQSLRLQFSLQFLLVAMALVGIAIVVYRWPWIEEGETRTVRFTTPYRRSWNGKPVKHGVEVARDLITNRVRKLWFQENVKVKEQWFDAGVLKFERHYRHGKAHGPFLFENDDVRIEGQYVQDKEHGKWTDTRADVIDHSEYHHGERHGRQEWRTPAGRLLQSAEYDAGVLVRWNNEPVTDELGRWLSAEVTDSVLRQRFLRPIRSPDYVIDTHSYYGMVWYHAGPGSRSFFIHQETRFSRAELGRVGQPIGEAILAEALKNSQTLAYRFNSLYVVPITARSLDWQDRTGINNVRFEPGSQQAKAWLDLGYANRTADYPVERLQRMFNPRSETGITIDTTAIKKPEPKPIPIDGTMLGGHRRPGDDAKFPRRDLLGKHLDMEGCYCEQQGNTLIIRRLE
jgi:hypothetical protein